MVSVRTLIRDFGCGANSRSHSDRKNCYSQSRFNGRHSPAEAMCPYCALTSRSSVPHLTIAALTADPSL